MRLPVIALSACFLVFSSQAFGLTEWTYHKTANGQHPDGQEQKMMWLMNRARQNPAAEGVWLATSNTNDIRSGRDYYCVNKTVLRNEFAATNAKPPAAFDVRLHRAARAHSLDLISRDAQDHNNQFARVIEEGFRFSQMRGNVFSYAWNSLNAHAGFNIDWGPPPNPSNRCQTSFDGMQNPRGHRMAIMAADGDYTNVGIAGIWENNSQTSVGPYVVSSNYARAIANGSDHFNKFVVGTVWEDKNGNDQYDVGEGIGGVAVTPNVGEYFAVTSDGGGYAFPVVSDGQLTLTFTGGSVLPWSTPVNVSGESVLVNYDTTDTSGGFGAALPKVVDLTPGVTDNNAYGFNYGESQHRNSLIARFGGAFDALLKVSGFDIDNPNEVKVFCNGKAIGYLRKGPNNGLAKASEFYLPAAMLRSTNAIEFRQVKPGFKWGVTQLQVEVLNQPNININESELHTGQYGSGYGSDAHPVSVKAVFNGGVNDLVLTVDGYDIDRGDEVKVLLNGKGIGFLKPTPNNAAGSSRIAIFKQQQQSGSNTLEFRQQTPGYKWGVTALLLTPETGPRLNLTPGETLPGVFGWNAGTSEHKLGVAAEFTGQGQDLLLSFRGYDVDNNSELRVYLNGMLIKKVPKGRNNAFDKTRNFLLPAQLQNQGAVNVVEVRQRVPGYKWAVRDLRVDNISGPVINLDLNTLDDNDYGWQYGSHEHQGVLRALFNQSGNDLTLEASGFDVDSANEVAVHLNGKRLGYLKAGINDKAAPLSRFTIVASEQIAGVNVVEFRQRRPGNSWGITNIALNTTTGPTASLSNGQTDFRAYGKDFGSDEHFNVLRGQFSGGTQDMLLGVIGFDMDSGGEIEVIVNGVSKGFLRKGKNNDYNAGNVFLLPRDQQINGTNFVEFRQSTPGFKWGVTYLQLAPADQD